MRFSYSLFIPLIIVAALLVSFFQTQSQSTGFFFEPLGEEDVPKDALGKSFCNSCSPQGSCRPQDGHICDEKCPEPNEAQRMYGENTCACISTKGPWESGSGGICAATSGSGTHTTINYDRIKNFPAVIVVVGSDGKKYHILINDWDRDGKVDKPHPNPPPPSDPTKTPMPEAYAVILGPDQEIKFVGENVVVAPK